MYPYLRLASVMMTERAKPRLALFDTHAMAMRCLPNDLDGFFEMNNGRILTLYDLGRFALSVRIGLWDVLRREGWGLVVARAMGHAGQSPALPDWVAGWVGGDQARPWPPMQDGTSSP